MLKNNYAVSHSIGGVIFSLEEEEVGLPGDDVIGVRPRHRPIVVEVPVLSLSRVPAVGRVVAAAQAAGVVRDGVQVVDGLTVVEVARRRRLAR